MPLFWFAVLVSAIGSGSLTLSGQHSREPLLAMFGIVMGMSLFAKLVAVTAARSISGMDHVTIPRARRFNRQMNALRWAWIPIGASAIAFSGYGQMLKTLSVIEYSVTLQCIGLVVPSAIFVLATWHVENEFNDLIFPDPSSPLTFKAAFISCLQQFRVSASWIILPLLVVMIVADLIGFVQIALGFQSESLTLACSLGILPFILPALIRLVWTSESINTVPSLQGIQRLVSNKYGKSLDLRLWHTEHRICTAMIVGMVPRFRLLMISDELIRRLSQAELALVIAHELAHVQRCHHAFRLIAVAPTLIACKFVASASNLDTLWQIVPIAIGLVLSAIAMRFISHATELDADHVACYLAAQDVPLDDEVRKLLPKSISEAAELLRSALIKVCAG